MSAGHDRASRASFDEGAMLSGVRGTVAGEDGRTENRDDEYGSRVEPETVVPQPIGANGSIKHTRSRDNYADERLTGRSARSALLVEEEELDLVSEGGPNQGRGSPMPERWMQHKLVQRFIFYKDDRTRRHLVHSRNGRNGHGHHQARRLHPHHQARRLVRLAPENTRAKRRVYQEGTLGTGAAQVEGPAAPAIILFYDELEDHEADFLHRSRASYAARTQKKKVRLYKREGEAAAPHIEIKDNKTDMKAGGGDQRLHGSANKPRREQVFMKRTRVKNTRTSGGQNQHGSSGKKRSGSPSPKMTTTTRIAQISDSNTEKLKNYVHSCISDYIRNRGDAGITMLCQIFLDRDAWRTSGLQTYMKIALPAAAQVVFEWILWELMALLAGLIGHGALACHVAGLTIYTITFTVALGMSSTCAQLVGQSLGEGRAKEARNFAVASVVVSTALSVVIMLSVNVFSADLADFFFPVTNSTNKSPGSLQALTSSTSTMLTEMLHDLHSYQQSFYDGWDDLNDYFQPAQDHRPVLDVDIVQEPYQQLLQQHTTSLPSATTLQFLPPSTSSLSTPASLNLLIENQNPSKTTSTSTSTAEALQLRTTPPFWSFPSLSENDASIETPMQESELLQKLLFVIFGLCFLPDCVQNVAVGALRACGWNQTSATLYFFQHYVLGLGLGCIAVTKFRSLLLLWMAIFVDLVVGIIAILVLLFCCVDWRRESQIAIARSANAARKRSVSAS
ncbi:unnamed protein product [Amoebophrya sp. A25]|nr:unnamed protein product [Amoebophrya sp. A25]|eukprot:GSA25T00009223001.1